MRNLILSLCTSFTLSFAPHRAVVRNSRAFSSGYIAYPDLETKENYINTQLRYKTGTISKTDVENRKLFFPQEDQFTIEKTHDEPKRRKVECLHSLKPVGREIVKKLEIAANSVHTLSILSDEITNDERYEQALENAKKADLKYGLCSEQSAIAWNLVDELYTSNTVLPSKKHIDPKVLKNIVDACKILNEALDELEEA